MLEIHVTVHCPDLVSAAQLLAKCSSAPTAASEGCGSAPLQAPVVNPTAAGAPATPTIPTTPQNYPSNPPVPAAPVPAAPVPAAPVPAAPVPAAPVQAVPLAQAPGFTLVDISKAGADLIGANPALLPKVNELLAQFGIQTLDKLKPDQFGAFATALRGLGAKI